MKVVVESHAPSETRRLGRRLAGQLREGDVVLLEGALGAGKTCFAQGIGAGLKVREPVKSSSFVLVNEYSGRLHVYHADLFRLDDPAEVFELALPETAADGLLLVEWPDRAPGEMPTEHLLVRFEILDQHSRQVSFEARGARYDEMVAAVADGAGAG
jgi:tRNA threonylcarbamoyladenosine biosynthesis protein TsaE